MNNYEQIEFKIEGSLAKIYLNRPSKLNAYTPDMGDEIINAFRIANSDQDIKAISFMGKGDSFCSGADRDYLTGNQLSKSGLKIGEDEFIKSFVLEISQSNKILIAGLHGSCVGIGITMILPFDIRIAEPNAKISFPFLKLGILPGLASTYFLPSLVGISKAKEIILTNANLSAQEAKEIGLINEVVNKNNLENAITEIALSFDAIDLNTLISAKKVFNPNLEEKVQDAINNERDLLKTFK
jgi:2-(1,2-epoxy-1,2-dihydrophenyl)acetyl-CoA isomerase